MGGRYGRACGATAVHWGEKQRRRSEDETYREGRRRYSSSSASSFERDDADGSLALEDFIQPATRLCVNAIDMSICAWSVSRSVSCSFSAMGSEEAVETPEDGACGGVGRGR